MIDLSLLQESLRRNGRVNAFLLEAISEADLDLSDGGGGWTVGQHLGHMANFHQGLALGHLSGPCLRSNRCDRA